jgi:hypothetical protein
MRVCVTLSFMCVTIRDFAEELQDVGFEGVVRAA